MVKLIEYTVVVRDDGQIQPIVDNTRAKKGTLGLSYLDLAQRYAKLVERDGIDDRAGFIEMGKSLYDILLRPIENSFLSLDVWHKIINGSEDEVFLRFRIAFQQNTPMEWVSLPWEFLYVEDGETFLGTDPRVAISLSYEDWLGQEADLADDQTLPLRILLATVNSPDLPGIAINPIVEALEKLENIDATKHEPLANPTLGQLQSALQHCKPHVFHMVTHGRFTIHGQLVLSSRDGKFSRWLEDQSFSDLFRAWKPHLVMLQSCEGGKTSETLPDSGVAQWIFKRYIPAVISMRYSFLQKYGWRFIEHVYDQLANGEPIDKAVQRGRLALSDSGEGMQTHASRNFGAPTLWMRKNDGRLFPQMPRKTVTISVEVPTGAEETDAIAAQFYCKEFIHQYENYELRGSTAPIVVPIFRNNLLQNFVPLNYLERQGKSVKPLGEYIDVWLDSDDRRNLVLLGELGSGKTAFCLNLTYMLLRTFSEHPRNSILPIYMTFREIISDAGSSSLEERIFNLLTHKYRIQLDPQTWLKVIRDSKVLFVLDGFDEIMNSHEINLVQRQFLKLRNILNVCSKVLITCRSNYFMTDEDVEYIFPISSQNMSLLDSIVGGHDYDLIYLADLNEKQQKQFLLNTLQDTTRLEQAVSTIKQSYNLPDLARRPILLGMVAKTIWDIDTDSAETITPTTLYGKYTDAWLRREFLTNRSDILLADKQKVMEGIALRLHQRNTEQMSRPNLLQYLEEIQAMFSENQKLDLKQIEYEFATCSFLIRLGDNYFGFVHRSFLEYFVAEGLLREIINNKAEFFGAKRIFGAVSQFLVDMIDRNVEKEQILDTLNRWIQDFRDNSTSPIYLVGNCVSVLCKSGFSFTDLNLSGLHIKDADLTNGDFRKSNFAFSNLDGSILTNADFSHSNFEGADLRNTFIKSTLFRNCNFQNGSFNNIRLINGPDTIWKAAFMPDGNNVIIGTDQGRLTVASIEDVELEDSDFYSFHVTDTGILHFALCPRGRTLAVSDRGKKVYLYEWSSIVKKEVTNPQILVGNSDNVRWLDFSPDGQVLVTSGRDHLVKLWHLEEHLNVEELIFHTGPIMCVKWSPDGKTIASGGYDFEVCLWYFDQEEKGPLCLHPSDGEKAHGGIVRGLAFNENGTLLATSGEDLVIKIWELSDPRHPKQVTQITTEETVFVLCYVDNKILIAGDSKGQLYRVDTLQGSLVNKESGHGDIVRSIDVDTRRNILLTSSWDGTVKLWKLDDLTLIRTVYAVDQTKNHYTPNDAFLGASLRGIQGLSEPFRRYFRQLGAIFDS